MGSRVVALHRRGQFLILDFETRRRNCRKVAKRAAPCRAPGASRLAEDDRQGAVDANGALAGEPGVLQLVTVTDDGEFGWSVELTGRAPASHWRCTWWRTCRTSPGIAALGPDAGAL